MLEGCGFAVRGDEGWKLLIGIFPVFEKCLVLLAGLLPVPSECAGAGQAQHA